MFTFRLNSYQLLQYLLIVFVSSEVIYGQQTLQKCAERGEYCLNHWDCCSNLCLSYSYRCVRRYNTDSPLDIRPTATLEQILEQNFGTANTPSTTQTQPYILNRIGGDSEVPTSEIKDVQQQSEQAITVPTAPKNISISEETATTVLYGNQLEETTTRKDPIDFEEIAAEQKDGLKEDTTETYKETSNTTMDTTFKSSPEKSSSCREIGVKCYRNEECCTQRCHGFLHQCVT